MVSTPAWCTTQKSKQNGGFKRKSKPDNLLIFICQVVPPHDEQRGFIDIVLAVDNNDSDDDWRKNKIKKWAYSMFIVVGGKQECNTWVLESAQRVRGID